MVKTAASQSKNGAIRIRHFGVIVSALLIAALLAGCGSVPKTHYYTLRMPPPPSNPHAKTNFILQVEQFDAPEIFRDDRIIYYTSPTELNFHQYHRWSSNPAALLSELAVRYFAETGLFEGVYAYPAPVHADYTLQGRVLSFAEIDYEKSGHKKARRGRVGLALELVRTRNNEVVWSVRKEDEVPIERKGIQGVVNALNTASRELFRNVSSGMAGVVEHEAAQEQDQSQ